MLYLLFVILTFIILSVLINLKLEFFDDFNITLDLNNEEGYAGYFYVLVMSLFFPIIYTLVIIDLFVMLIAKGADKLSKFIISQIESKLK